MNSFVTTEDCCSHCGSKLENVETARLNWQKEACDLKEQLDQAQRSLFEWHNAFGDKDAQQVLQLWKSDVSERDVLIGDLRGKLERAQRERDEAITALHDVFECASRQKSNRDCATLEGIVGTAKAAVRVIRKVADEAKAERDEATAEFEVYRQRTARTGLTEINTQLHLECDDLKAKLRQLELSQSDQIIEVDEDGKVHYPNELTELKAKLLTSDAAGASLRHQWEIGYGRAMANFGHVPEAVRAVEWIEHEMQKALLSTSCGKPLLAELERKTETLRQIAEENPPSEKPRDYSHQSKEADEFALEVAAWFCARVGDKAREALKETKS